MKWWCWWWWRWSDKTVMTVMVMMIATNTEPFLFASPSSKHFTDINSIHPDSNSIRCIHYYYLHLLVWKLRYRKVSVTCPRSRSRPWTQESSRVHPFHPILDTGSCPNGEALAPWVGKIPWRRKWQPTPVFRPGESHGQRRRWATVHGVIKRHNWATNTFTFFPAFFLSSSSKIPPQD